uniref:Uncharacterized protein n=1 Tax=Oryza glumipatula TaxID=40148 RepID=A0A0E0AWG3_9ORYZ
MRLRWRSIPSSPAYRYLSYFSVSIASRPYTGSTATPSATGELTNGGHELCRVEVVRHHVAELEPNDEAAGHECSDLDEQHELTLLLPLRRRPLFESPLHTGSVIVVVLPPPPPIGSILAPYDRTSTSHCREPPPSFP